MSSLERLYRLLEPLRIYALRKNSLIDRELEAYEAGFSMILELMEQLRLDIFPQTASGDALALHEQCAGLPIRAGIPDGERRALILDRGQRPPLPTPAGVIEILEAAGFILPQIKESAGKLYISAEGYADGISEAAAWELAAAGLPAHLEITSDAQGKDWQSLDDRGLCWLDLDERAQSWDALAHAVH